MNWNREKKISIHYIDFLYYIEFVFFIDFLIDIWLIFQKEMAICRWIFFILFFIYFVKLYLLIGEKIQGRRECGWRKASTLDTLCIYIQLQRVGQAKKECTRNIYIYMFVYPWGATDYEIYYITQRTGPAQWKLSAYENPWGYIGYIFLSLILFHKYNISIVV